MGDNAQWYNPMSWDGPLIWIWLALYVIVLVRAGATYLLGRGARAGVGRLATVNRFLETPRYQRAETALDRWGAPMVAVSFLTVGFQTAVNLTAGLIRMAWYRYLPALAVGGAIWATIYSTIGVVSFAAIGMAYDRWPTATVSVVVVLLLALLVWVDFRLRQRRSGHKNDHHPDQNKEL